MYDVTTPLDQRYDIVIWTDFFLTLFVVFSFFAGVIIFIRKYILKKDIKADPFLYQSYALLGGLLWSLASFRYFSFFSFAGGFTVYIFFIIMSLQVLWLLTFKIIKDMSDKKCEQKL